MNCTLQLYHNYEVLIQWNKMKKACDILRDEIRKQVSENSKSLQAGLRQMFQLLSFSIIEDLWKD
ncbi:hypothetical protein M918_18585 [Clostridium sp. BL8]|nr:hypothetical protein M918_18585 [Clostridium sp. BL8]